MINMEWDNNTKLIQRSLSRCKISPNCFYMQYFQQAARTLLEHVFSQIAHKSMHLAQSTKKESETRKAKMHK
jgi:hypothetical protein